MLVTSISGHPSATELESLEISVDSESVYKLEAWQQSTCCGTLSKILSSVHSVSLPFELDPNLFPLCYNHTSLKKAIKDSGLLEFRLCS